MSLDQKKSPYVLGIDLGTTNTSASLYVKGTPEVIPISVRLASLGGKSIPSVVRFKDKNKDNMVVGREAKKHILLAPDEVFSSIKTIMRRDDWTSDTVFTEKLKAIDDSLEPCHIAAEILRALLEEVQHQDQVDPNGLIQRAVICVPANSTDHYKEQVYEAAKLAGLGETTESGELIIDDKGRPKGVSLLEEPTAAAIEYGRQMDIWKEEKEQTILVYDMGGGTFDVTILKVDSTGDLPKFTPVNTKGEAVLGGDDIDKVLMEMCGEAFQDSSEIDIFDLKSDQKATSPKALKQAQQTLKERAEESKIAFSNGAKSEEINIPNFLKDGDGQVHNLEVEIKRKDFVERIQPILDKANQCVKDALEEASLTLSDINRVVMVGGSTKASWIKDAIRSLYPENEERDPFVAANVDVIVSQGAAVEGASKLWDYDENAELEDEDKVEVEVEGIVSHHLGVELKGQKFALVIPKGLPLTDEEPIQKVKRIFGNPDMRESVQITAWKTQKTMEYEESEDSYVASESHMVNEKDDNEMRMFECVGEFVLKGIPRKKGGSLEVEVTMEINKENLLNVSASCSGVEGNIELDVTKN